MDDQVPINEIPKDAKNWSAIITVQEKLQRAQAKNSPQSYQKYIFVDRQGARVEAVTFNQNIDKMGSRINVYKRYKISNAKVQEIPEVYQREGIKMQWIITSRTVMEELPDENTMLPIVYQFTKFSDIGNFVGSTTAAIDIIGIVVQVLPQKSVQTSHGTATIQKYIVVDEMLQSITLTLWNNFITTEGEKIQDDAPNFPIVLARRLKATYFNGIELQPKLTSVVLVNPRIKEAMHLRTWAQKNRKKIMEFLANKSHLKTAIEIPAQPEENITMIANILSSQKSAWVKIAMTFEDSHKNCGIWHVTNVSKQQMQHMELNIHVMSAVKNRQQRQGVALTSTWSMIVDQSRDQCLVI